MMDGPEPLIAEYDLKKWMDPHYSGTDPLKKSQPVKQANYRGLLRHAGSAVQTADEAGEQD
jgi:putative DNA primase/helicase